LQQQVGVALGEEALRALVPAGLVGGSFSFL